MVVIEHIDVFKGRNAPSKIEVSLKGVPMDFLNIPTTKMGVEIAGVEYSSTDGFISYANGGVIIFTLGAVPNPPKKTVIGRVIMYTADFPNGNPIINESTDYRVAFTFR